MMLVKVRYEIKKVSFFGDVTYLRTISKYEDSFVFQGKENETKPFSSHRHYTPTSL
jgi:hypothetical protein